MGYSTIPQYDVSIHGSQRGVACLLCSFGDMMERAWVAESTQEMVDHLESHRRVGDRVPEDITERLWADNAANYPKPFLPKA
jgi:hypothetical protein